MFDFLSLRLSLQSCDVRRGRGGVKATGAGRISALALTLFVAGVFADDADDAGAFDDPAIVAYTFD